MHEQRAKAHAKVRGNQIRGLVCFLQYFVICSTFNFILYYYQFSTISNIVGASLEGIQDQKKDAITAHVHGACIWFGTVQLQE